MRGQITMSWSILGEEFILILQILAIIGFSFLSVFTIVSYLKRRTKLLLYIAAAFGVISFSIIFAVFFFESLVLIIGIDEPYLEAILESIQFLAAFLFFYGLKMLKTDKKPAEVAK